MHRSMRIALALVAALVFLTACGTESNRPGRPTKVVTRATVDLSHFSVACDKDPKCWLPTQFSAKLAAGQSMSRFDEWPLKGDAVGVVCEINGERLTDSRGEATTLWYGILIPAEKLATQDPIGDGGMSARPIGSGYLAYVSSLWLRFNDVTAKLPTC